MELIALSVVTPAGSVQFKVHILADCSDLINLHSNGWQELSYTSWHSPQRYQACEVSSGCYLTRDWCKELIEYLLERHSRLKRAPILTDSAPGTAPDTLTKDHIKDPIEAPCVKTM